MGVVGNQRRVRDTVRLLDPLAGAASQPRSFDGSEKDPLVSNDRVDLCAVVALDTEADLLVRLEVVAALRDGGLVNEGELVRRDAVFVRWESARYDVGLLKARGRGRGEEGPSAW